jgi:hypothetical protein
VEVPDSIEREVTLPAPPARVWTALTPPELRGRSHASHIEGWQRELGELKQYLAVR